MREFRCWFRVHVEVKMHVLFGESSLWGIVLSVIHWQIASARNIENMSIFFIKICQLLVKLYMATCYPL